MKKNGFTLIELVIVIVLLGVVSYLGFNLLSPTVEGYVDTRIKTFLFNEAQYGVERIARELRNAVPNSIRILDSSGDVTTGDGTGIQFVKFKDVGYYDNVTSYSSYDNISCYNININIGDNVSIYNTKPDYLFSNERIYNINSILDNSNSKLCELDKTISQESPYNRIFVIDEAVTFYFSGDKIYRSSGYEINNENTGIDSGGNIMISYVDNFSISYTQGDTYNSAIVKINVVLKKNNISVDYGQEVHIRNVP